MATDYLKQRRENKTLASQIEAMSQSLAQIPPSPADLEQRLIAAESDLDATRNELPERLNTTEVINTILRLAEDTGVKAIPLITQPWRTESFSEHDYSVFRLDISITGNYTQLADFISQLENGELNTLLIESFTVERADDETAEEGTIPIDASAAVAVFARPPVVEETEESELEEVE